MTEKELIIGCSEGRRDCQRELYETYSAKMLAVCYRYIGDKDTAHDLLHDGFINLFTHIKEFKFKGSFEGWARRIFVTTALNFIRRERRFVESSSDDMVELGDNSHIDILDSLSSSELLSLLEKLPDGYRTVLNMYAIEGYSHKEIGEALGIGESSSRSQLLRAKKMFKGLLERSGDKVY